MAVISDIKTQLLQSFKNFYEFLGEKCVNNLTSTSTTLPLAASQGKVLNDRITENIDVSKNISEKLVPIGYIFTWTNVATTSISSSRTLDNAPDLTTATAVKNYFGFGTWERIYDLFLYSGSGNSIGGTGGTSTVTLSTANIPSHTHSIPALSGHTAQDGEHTHSINVKYKTDATTSGNGSRVTADGPNISGVAGTALLDGLHSHSLATNASTTGATGGTTAHNNMPPYVNVYMWMRVG